MCNEELENKLNSKHHAQLIPILKFDNTWVNYSMIHYHLLVKPYVKIEFMQVQISDLPHLNSDKVIITQMSDFQAE